MDIQMFFNTLDRLFSEKRPQEAEAFMRERLSQAEKESDAGAVVTICNELGGYYRAVSRYEEGVPLYQRALQIIADLHQEGTPAHGTTLINYATTCTMKRDFEKALQLYEEAAAIFSGPDYGPDFNLAILYNNMSFVCQDMGDFSRAEDYLLKALGILRQLTESDIEIATTYTNLANLYMAMGKVSEARDLLEKAIDIYLRETGGKDVHYAASVSALGDLCYLEGDYASASQQFEQALTLVERDYGTDNDSYRTIEKNLSLSRQQLEKKAHGESDKNE